jgi:[acyl-carrier-protein] S-malonyltransferase
MVSVFPVEAALVEHVIARLELGDRVGIGLYNAPKQQVVSGERSAVETVVSALHDEVFIQAVEIEPRIPMHAPVFAATGDRLAAELARVELTAPSRPYVPNTRAEVIDDPDAALIRACLVEHVSRPVRWQSSVEAIARRAPEPLFYEVGPKSVLYQLFGRGWTPGLRERTDSDGR